LNQGVGHEVARCVSGRVVSSFSVEQLNDPEPDAATMDAVRRRTEESVSACS